MIEELLQQLIEQLDNRYYGKFRGFVHRTDDPLDLGRIQAIVPRLFDDKTPTGWASPCTPYAGPDQGFYTVPELGSAVWIEFEEGDLSRPIWSGMWWGGQTPEDVGVPGATAPSHPRAKSELPQHRLENAPKGPGEIAVPGVRILKSATGHHIVLDDRPKHARIEIHDSEGNRIILDRQGITRIVSNERTDNQGKRSTEILDTDELFVGERRSEDLGGLKRVVRGDQTVTIDGALVEKVEGGGYSREITGEGTQITYGGKLHEKVRGQATRKVIGRSQETATGGWSVSAGRGLSMSTLGSVSIQGTLPELPSFDTVSLKAAIGNININTMLGFLQLGGASAISPLVLGDGLMIHNTMLGAISRAFFSPASLAYGPLMDVWSALTFPVGISLFARVKRFPFGP
jgi:hypothetical protein